MNSPQPIKFPRALQAWGSEEFAQQLKQAVEGLESAQLPLQQGLELSNVVSDQPFTVMFIRAEERHGNIAAKVGIFYTGVIDGCSCADDPTPVDENNEYCEVEILIDRVQGNVRIGLWQD